MKPLDDAAVAEIERLHRENKLTLAQIGERFGCTATYISALARRRGWLMRSEMLGRAPRKTTAASTPKARAALAHRLCDVINQKLDQMEKDMQSGELSSADLERDAKSVASMIGGMEKVVTGPDEDKERQPRAAAIAAVNDVERIHREIIERFERIQRRREAERGSG